MDSKTTLILAACVIAAGIASTGARARADDAPANGREVEFAGTIRPMLGQYCTKCHGPDEMKSGIRVDLLDGSFREQHLTLWHDIAEQLEDEEMPPDNKPQPTEDERARMVEWIKAGIKAAQIKGKDRNGWSRRLTVPQYRNTLRDLLGLEDNLAKLLPGDGVSKDGFTNDGATLQMSPLQMEYYLEIAGQALELCLVDPAHKPVIQTFRMDLGRDINATPSPAKLILGAGSHLLRNADFKVTELAPMKPFAYEPVEMKREFDFIEGYEGNSTVRGQCHFSGLEHAVFACVRGTDGYPRGEAVSLVAGAMLLRPAIPSTELFGMGNTMGPMANFKISLRDLPASGQLRVKVTASRFDHDGLLLDPATRPARVAADITAVITGNQATARIPEPGIYQVDMAHTVRGNGENLELTLNGRPYHFHIKSDKATGTRTDALMLVRLDMGELHATTRHGANLTPANLSFKRVPAGGEQDHAYTAFAARVPQLGVRLGFRRDCGSTLPLVAPPRPVAATTPTEYVFTAAINDFPSPAQVENNPNYLAGIREIGVRSEYTDGRDLPRLRIHSVEVEGPYLTCWPPVTHTNIFIASPHQNDPPVYAREILESFMARAYRRTPSAREVALVHGVWARQFKAGGDFRACIKDALLVVLTSPQFLYLVESSATPAPEDLSPHELASKLSYFLWNTMPDTSLRQAADAGTLHGRLDAEVNRLLDDPRARRFFDEFATQWLALDKFDVVEVDRKMFPKMDRDTREQLRREPAEFLRHLVTGNLPARNLVDSEFILANDVTASYYGLGARSESGFEFKPVAHHSSDRGGLLTQAGILCGLSSGRESNPVKRGAWMARKIVAEPPGDPPPNVPELKEGEGKNLTLRQRLEQHRNQKGCIKCHEKIDPWGVPLEEFDAGGMRKMTAGNDASSTLPDGTDVAGFNALRTYLADARIDQVAYSFMKHLATYALGRSLTIWERETLQKQCLDLRPGGYKTRDMIHALVKSDLFLKK